MYENILRRTISSLEKIMFNEEEKEEPVCIRGGNQDPTRFPDFRSWEPREKFRIRDLKIEHSDIF